MDPAAQGRGVGTELLTLTEHEGGRRGYARLQLYTNEAMTENLDYYPRKGYVESHRAKQGRGSPGLLHQGAQRPINVTVRQEGSLFSALTEPTTA